MKIIIGLIIGFILFFNYCVFKVASNASRIEEREYKEEYN